MGHFLNSKTVIVGNHDNFTITLNILKEDSDE